MAELEEVPTDELLLFHDFPTTHNTTASAIPQYINTDTANIPNYDEFAEGKGNSNDSNDSIDQPNATKSFWTMEYFQQFFNVDTRDVHMRIIGSILPTNNSTLRTEMRERPDLYGPFWICITLIFAIAVSGNIADYLQYTKAEWKYDFHIVTYAATAIFMYITLIPLCLWATMKWSIKSINIDDFPEQMPNVLELICIYGYSLFIYIPASVLWTIQVNWLQWLLVMVSAILSGSVLLLSLSNILKLSKHKIVLSLLIVGFHLLLAAGFMLYFFHAPSSSSSTTLVPITMDKIINIPKNVSESHK
ncbi:PREDICTED: protein YIPF1 [Nicrophorus vespilloides]|uniref:Protein YIPF n=1 Tax=Nicrophorus vespilloides TaxID=110193 RepID=A0ABM1M8A6_NICVS|nr:PREDICTED: protein YIPF1 [Nicrophorus vespilloides]